MKEIWKDISGYEGLYQVSNLGRVKRVLFINNQITKSTDKILKLIKERGGYVHVNLYKNNTSKRYLVHRLVANAFIDNPDNLPQVNHKNEIKDDNRSQNLEWCTNLYNNNYGTKKERLAKVRMKRVRQYDRNGNVVKDWDSISMAEKELNIDHSCILRCCKLRQKTAGGFIWRYYD